MKIPSRTLFRLLGDQWALAAAFAVGAGLRAWHAAITRLGAHTLDWEAHLEYVRYVLRHWDIPVAASGWEYYQPPLYYFLTAFFVKAGWWATDVSGMLSFAFVVSLLTLLLVLQFGTVLFPDKPSRFLFAMLLATAPELVYFSANINNDILVFFLSILSLLFLQQWWKSGSQEQWVYASLAASLAILAKSTGLLLLPVLLGSLLWKKGWTRKTLKLGGTCALIVAVLTSWIFFMRMTEGEYGLIGNRSWVSQSEAVQYNATSFLSFNPVRLWKDPYNHPWVATSGKERYWEYFFRSAFTGEWDYTSTLSGLTRMVYVMAMALLPLVLYGVWLDAGKRFRPSAPLLLTFVVYQAASIAYCVMHPFAPLQDFRYAAPILLPLSYFCVRGFGSLRREWGVAAAFLIGGFIFSSFFFMIEVTNFLAAR